MPIPSRTRISPFLTLLIGLAIGGTVASLRGPSLRASGGDRSDESIVATGPTYTRYNEGTKVQVTQDAVYFLDYRAGKLLMTIPSANATVGGTKIIDHFAERDLVADFKLDVNTGGRPHFLMTATATVTGSTVAYGDGGSLLMVFETTTRQVAIYRAEQKTFGDNAQINLVLLQVRPYSQPVATR